MEMNTRLQVEHPVTEWITGIDIVKEQIRIAFGEKLTFRQEEIQARGHAIEFRINAEDPEKFLPQAGRVTGVTFPTGPGIRVDSHVYRGYEVPVFYDSMIAKISSWGKDRNEAMIRGKCALEETILNGIKTNVPLHLQLLQNEKFRSGNYTTRLIGEDFHYKAREVPESEARMGMIAAAVSAFRKEYTGGPSGDANLENNSHWKWLGRKDGLR
jgi:acetyl-CoA carboxylase biotin carboxylase subunit